MKKRRVQKRFFIFLIFILSVIIVSLFIFFNPEKIELTFNQQETLISLTDNSQIYPLSTGFLVIDDSITYFNKKNQVVPLTLPDTFNNSESFYNIGQYIVLSDNSLFEIIDESPVQFSLRLPEFNSSIRDIKTVSNGLVVKRYDGSINYLLEYYTTESSNLIKPPTNSLLLEAAVKNNTSEYSVLFLIDQGPFTGNIIRNFENNELVGEIVLNDAFYYDLLRFESYAILIGSSSIACYNIDTGNQLWEKTFATPDKLVYCISGDNVFVGASSAVFDNQSIFIINKNSELQIVSFTDGVTSVVPSKKGFVFSVKDGIFSINNELNLTKLETKISSPKQLTYSHSLNRLYALDYSGQLDILQIK